MESRYLSKIQLEEQLETFRRLNNLDNLSEERIGNEERTDLEIKRATIAPKPAISDEGVRSVRAAALGMTQYQYEQNLLDLGQDY